MPAFRCRPLRACLAAALLIAGGACAAADLSAPPAQPAAAAELAVWREQLRQEALTSGISEQTFDQALGDFQPLARVIELDQRQPEFVDTFWNYLDRRVDERRLALGKERLHEHRKLLNKVQSRYGLPPALLVSFWGLETNYGATTGGFSVPIALATLAYDHRRSAFFRAELLNALSILEQGHVPVADMKGSWAGAMGQMQFMPSTFLRYAVDGDDDGHKDIWRSLPDAFHSAANYLHRIGWHAGEIWGREVRLPKGFDFESARLDIKRPVQAWTSLGVRRADGKALPKSRISSAIVLPQGHAGPAFLVYRNFDVIMQWNRSINYALAIGHLADRLNGAPELKLGRDADNRRLTREQLIEIQQLLAQFGFDPGELDGVPGLKTRQAIRAYQQSAGLPADGHASAGLLEYLQKAKPAGV